MPSRLFVLAFLGLVLVASTASGKDGSTPQTLADWAAVGDGPRNAFSYSLAQNMGAHAPSLYADDVRRCLDEKAKQLPGDTLIGKIIDDCAEPVPSKEQVLAAHSVAVKLSKAGGYRLDIFTTDDGPEQEWTARAIAGEEPRAQHNTVKALKAKTIAIGTHANEIIATMKSRPDWVFAAPAEGDLWLSWYDGNCHPIQMRIDNAGRYTGIAIWGLCSRPGVSFTIDSFPEDDESCELHPDLKYCSVR